MKLKYVEERYGFWLIFGEHPDGWVDIISNGQEILTGVPKEIAQDICDRHNQLLVEIFELAQAFSEADNEAFNQHWWKSLDSNETTEDKALRSQCPWPTHSGDTVFVGDVICHPSGEQGTIVFVSPYAEAVDRWRVDYGDEYLSRLALQIGEKGQAEKVPDAGIETT